MKPKCYREKPVVVKAIQWKWENWNDICDFIPVPDVLYVPQEEVGKEFPCLRIKTLEGEHIVSYGDYIVKGVQGEFYPCKSDIFRKTYEEIECAQDLGG